MEKGGLWVALLFALMEKEGKPVDYRLERSFTERVAAGEG
jgi:hypothetical protein